MPALPLARLTYRVLDGNESVLGLLRQSIRVGQFRLDQGKKFPEQIGFHASLRPDQPNNERSKWMMNHTSYR